MCDLSIPCVNFTLNEQWQIEHSSELDSLSLHFLWAESNYKAKIECKSKAGER